MTEFRYGDEVWWFAYHVDNALPAVVVDERRFQDRGGHPGGGEGNSPEPPWGIGRNLAQPVFIRVADESEPRWVDGRDLALVRPRVDED